MLRLVRDDEMPVDELPADEHRPQPAGPTDSTDPPDMTQDVLSDVAPGRHDELSEPADGIVAGDVADEPGTPDPTSIDLAVMEALLFATHHPLTPGRLAELMGLPSTRPVRQGAAALNAAYEASGRAFRVEQVAGGYQLLTLPQYAEALKKLHHREADAKLTKAALETLAIIAYKQPVLRADIEAIRGVACGETIRSLMEKRLVKIDGRAEEPGRPILYGTTRRFLEQFGLNSAKDLPRTDPHAKAS